MWSAGGDASFNLSTSGSLLNMTFNVSLGHPGSPAPYSAALPAPAPSHRQKQPGPAQKDCDRQRAAHHQAALRPQATPAATIQVKPTVPVSVPELAPTAPSQMSVPVIAPTVACSIFTQTRFYKLVFCSHMQAITTKTIEKKLEFI